MGTINHIRVARSNTFIGMECEKDHPHKEKGEFPFYLRGRNTKPVPEWDRLSNVCPGCHMSKSANGTCPGCE